MAPWSIGQPFSHVDAYAASNYIGDNGSFQAMRQMPFTVRGVCCSRMVAGAPDAASSLFSRVCRVPESVERQATSQWHTMFGDELINGFFLFALFFIILVSARLVSSDCTF